MAIIRSPPLRYILWGVLIYHTHATTTSSTTTAAESISPNEIIIEDIIPIDLSHLPSDLSESHRIGIPLVKTTTTPTTETTNDFTVISSSPTHWLGATNDDVLKLTITPSGSLRGSLLLNNFTYQLNPSPPHTTLNRISFPYDDESPQSHPHIRKRDLTALNCSSTPNTTSLFHLNLTTDSASFETKWSLVGSDGVAILASRPLDPESTSVVEECIPSDQCFRFTVYDIGDDGMCCDFSTRRDGGLSMSYDGEEMMKIEGPKSFSRLSVTIGNCEVSVAAKLKMTIGALLPGKKEFDDEAAACKEWCRTAVSVPWIRGAADDASQPQKCDWVASCGGCEECGVGEGVMARTAEGALEFVEEQWSHLKDKVRGEGKAEDGEREGEDVGDGDDVVEQSMFQKVSQYVATKWENLRSYVTTPETTTTAIKEEEETWDETTWAEMGEVSALPCRTWCEGNEVPWRANPGENQKCDWLISCSGCKQCDPSFNEMDADTAFAQEMKDEEMAHYESEMHLVSEEQVEDSEMNEDTDNEAPIQEPIMVHKTETPPKDEETTSTRPAASCKDWCKTITDQSDEDICKFYHCAGCEHCA